MHAQLWPLYAIGALMFLYVLFSIVRDAWELLKYEPPAEPFDDYVHHIEPTSTPFMDSIKRQQRNDLNNV